MITELDHLGAGADILGLWNRWEAELPPGGRRIGLGELRRRFLNPGHEGIRHDWLVERDGGGRPRGLAHLERWFQSANREITDCEILVDSGARRFGVARSLLAHLLDLAEADDRSSLIAWGPRTAACTGFWEAHGLVQRYVEQTQRCDLTKTNAALMQQWIDAAAAHTAHYELVFWRGARTERWAGAYAQAENAMNGAPIDELEMHDYDYDVAFVRARDNAFIDAGLEPWVYLVVDLADGSAAGVTEVLVNEHEPAYSEQWSTVVLAEHRGRGLGRWLKAAMFLRLCAERPDVRYLDTGNGTSNAAMRAINTEMGFELYREFACWQGDVAAIRARL